MNSYPPTLQGSVHPQAIGVGYPQSVGVGYYYVRVAECDVTKSIVTDRVRIRLKLRNAVTDRYVITDWLHMPLATDEPEKINRIRCWLKRRFDGYGVHWPEKPTLDFDWSREFTGKEAWIAVDLRPILKVSDDDEGARPTVVWVSQDRCALPSVGCVEPSEMVHELTPQGESIAQRLATLFLKRGLVSRLGRKKP